MHPIATSTIEWFRYPEDILCSGFDLLVFTKKCEIYAVYWRDETDQFFLKDSPFLDEIVNVLFWAFMPKAVYPIQIIANPQAVTDLLKNREGW